MSDVELVEFNFGGASIDIHGVPLTDEAYAAIRSSDAILFGAVGGPSWDYDETLEEKPGADKAQPVLVVKQGVRDDGQPEPGDDAKDRIGRRRAKPRHQPRERAVEDRAADAQDPDGPSRQRDDDPDQHAL